MNHRAPDSISTEASAPGAPATGTPAQEAPVPRVPRLRRYARRLLRPLSDVTLGGVLRAAAILAGYGVLWLFFETRASAFETAAGVSPWDPAMGLHLALLLMFGPAYGPAVFATSLAGSLLFTAPALPFGAASVSSLIVTGCACLAAWRLLRAVPLPYPPPLRSLGPFVLGSFGLPAAVAVLTVGAFALLEVPGYTSATALPSAFNGWIEGVLGILTFLPLVLGLPGLALPRLQRRPVLRALGTGAVWLLERALEAGGLVLALYLAFFFPGGADPQYYFCFLPLLWIALRHGLPGAGLAVLVLNLGAIVAMRGRSETGLIGDFQLFLLTLALTGLFLGALVSQRRRGLAALLDARRALEAEVEERALTLETTRRDLTAQIDQRNQAEAALKQYVNDLQASRDQLAVSIDEQAQLNAKLRASEQQLRDLNARKDKFFSIISHDVKNMLVSTIGFAQLLHSDAETLPREMIKEFASHVHTAASHTYDLLENLLNWTRLQTGRMHYQRAWHSINELIRLNILMLQTNALQKHITIRQETGPDTQVYADRNMINSVLQNLIMNALKFTRQGGEIVVGTTTYEHTVEVSVTDTGVGIAAEDLPKLFRIDVQHSTAGTDEESGTGLGLILCREMIEKHEGRIWAESEPGRGSTFRFTLPCAKEAQLEEEVVRAEG